MDLPVSSSAEWRDNDAPLSPCPLCGQGECSTTHLLCFCPVAHLLLILVLGRVVVPSDWFIGQPDRTLVKAPIRPDFKPHGSEAALVATSIFILRQALIMRGSFGHGKYAAPRYHAKPPLEVARQLLAELVAHHHNLGMKAAYAHLAVFPATRCKECSFSVLTAKVDDPFQHRQVPRSSLRRTLCVTAGKVTQGDQIFTSRATGFLTKGAHVAGGVKIPPHSVPSTMARPM